MYNYSACDIETLRKPINLWLEEYYKVISSYNISDKTRANRIVLLKWIAEHLGDKEIGFIKPYEIALELKLLYKISPPKAKRMLIEIKNMFTEAIIYGWVERNPAAYLKAQPYLVARERLTFEDWSILYAEAQLHAQPWVGILLRLALLTGQRRADLCKMKFSDVWDNYLHVQQQKTGTKLAISTQLRLPQLQCSITSLLSEAKYHSKEGEYVLRKHNGQPLCEASLSAAFEKLVDTKLPNKNTSLHECRSLSERLYREQGLDTRLLLGHKYQAMTDMYNDIRGLNKDSYTEVNTTARSLSPKYLQPGPARAPSPIVKL